MSAVDELMQQFAEEDKANTVTEQSTTVEPAEETEHVEAQPSEEPEVSEDTDKPTEVEPSEEPEETEDKPTEEKPKKEHEPIPDDPMKRAEFSFRRQLAKKDEKYAKLEKELSERDEKYAKLEKEFAEFREQMKPKEAPMTRDKFPEDEDYLKYLA